MAVRTAVLLDHPRIAEIAKMSKYTSGATSPHYLNEKAYERGWVAVSVDPDWVRIEIWGFVVVRHLIRKPYTSLYYVGMDPAAQHRGHGKELVQWVCETSPWQEVRLICEKSNAEVVDWYLRQGFVVIGEGANKSGAPYWRLAKISSGWRRQA